LDVGPLPFNATEYKETKNKLLNKSLIRVRR
jgi:hypothetical protein